MVSFSSPPSPVLRSPPSSPRCSRYIARQLSPSLVRLRYPQFVHCIAAALSAPRTSPGKLRYPSSNSTNSLYKVLGIPIGASNDEIKAAYRRLARTCHPDVAISGGDEFIKIHGAYSTLLDPDKRAEYDRTLIRRFASFSDSETISFGTYPRRNWETDQCW